MPNDRKQDPQETTVIPNYEQWDPQEINVDHAQQYIAERVERWGMARTGEPIAAQLVSGLIKEITSCGYVEAERYDELWFELQEPREENDWMRGAPDYCLKIVSDSAGINSPLRVGYMYLEIKLKTKKFRKTVTGGNTQQGSTIPNYGCCSYYLDVTPVHQNMNLFCQNTGIDKKNFVIAFVDLDNSEVKVISLHQINTLIEQGWRENNIATYGEGYGQDCYLIPEDATYDLSKVSNQTLKESLRQYVSLNRVEPVVE